MKYGIYYAYWEDQWKADYFKYIEKVAKLGFDFLEIACTPINGYDRQTLKDLRQAAKDNGISLTAGHGPSADQNLGSPDAAVRRNAKKFFTTLLKKSGGRTGYLLSLIDTIARATAPALSGRRSEPFPRPGSPICRNRGL